MIRKFSALLICAALATAAPAFASGGGSMGGGGMDMPSGMGSSAPSAAELETAYNAGVAAVEAQLARSEFSIHLIGESYGAVPDGLSQKSVVVLQNEVAVNKSKSGSFPRIIWLPEGTSSAQISQHLFIEALHQELVGFCHSRTSLIAISEEPTVDPKQPRRVERLAVEVPYGVSAEGAGLHYPAAAMHVVSRMARTVDAEMPSGMIEAHHPVFKMRSDAMRRTEKRMFDPITAHRVEWHSRDELAFVISIALAGRDDTPRVIELRLHDGRRVSAQLVIVGLAALRRPDDATEMRILLPAGIEVTELSTCRCIHLGSGGGFLFDLEIPANRPEQP